MTVIEFRFALVATDDAGFLLIALFDGPTMSECVGLARCTNEAGRELMEALGSALSTEGK